MKITITKKELNAAIAGLSKVIVKKLAVPILSVFKISIGKNGVRITATNLDEWLTWIINNTPGPESSFLINIQELKEFISQTKSVQNYEFTVIDESHVKVNTGNNNSPERIFKTLPADEWPKMPYAPKNNNKVSSKIFKYIKQAVPSTSKDDTRTVLKGVLLEPDSVVATNGKELVQFQCKTGLTKSVILPTTKFLASGRLAYNDCTVSIESVNGRDFCVFATERWEYSVIDMIGIYPNYKQVIPGSSSSSIQISSDDIENLQRGIPLLESTSEHKAVHLFANANEISILPENLNGVVLKAKGVYRGLGSSQPVVISMNRKFLLRALSLGFNKFSFNKGYSPVISTGINSKSLMVFMPLKGDVSIEKILEKVNKQAGQYSDTQRQNIAVESEIKQAVDRGKTVKNEQVPKITNKQFTEKEVKMSETKTKHYPPIIKPATTVETDPISELMDSITILKIKARDVIDLATDLMKKVKDIQKSKKIQEREFKNTRELLVKLQKVSGF